MRIIPMHNNADFDVDMSLAEIKVDDTNLFSKAEQPSVNLFNSIIGGTIEMKSHLQTLKTGNLFIEYKIDTKGDGEFNLSGLSVTKADYWFLNIGEMGLFLSYNFLKYLYDYRDALKIDSNNNGKTAKDHIGYGLIIPMWRLMELYMCYNQHLIIQRIKEIQGL